MSKNKSRLYGVKKIRNILICINLVFVVCFLSAVFVPVDRKDTLYSSTDASIYDKKTMIPKLGGITNSRDAEIHFSVYEQEIYGIGLYFYVDGTDDEGDIKCTLKLDDQVVAEDTVTIRELMATQSSSSINETELYLRTNAKQSGEYTLLLQGENISPDTRVALYGSRNADHMLSYVNANSDHVADIFYSLEVMKPQYPYIWMTAMILAMSLLFSYLIYSNLKEKNQ